MHRKKTVVHVADQLSQNTGPIAVALEGLLTCEGYLNTVGRSIIIGSFPTGEQTFCDLLGPDVEVAYSSCDESLRHPYSHAFQEVERKFAVAIVYGYRTLCNRCTRAKAQAEVVFIDVTRANPHPVNALKAWMFEEFGIESDRYESNWQYDLHVKLAPAALAILRAIGACDPAYPGILIAHDYMQVPTALAAIMDPMQTFKTIFYAHEVPTARHLIENHPGHDTMFYNAMNWAGDNDYYLTEIFGSQDASFKHILVSAARHCDGIIAASENVTKELHFLDPQFDTVDIDLGFNGLAAYEISLADKHASKARLQQYAVNLLDYQPDYVFTHVNRMTLSNGLWRDLRVLEHLERQFRRDGRTAILFLLGTDLARRSQDNIYRMEKAWNWPVAHREKFPDLSPAEAAFYTAVQEFNARSRNIKTVLINQAVWENLFCGRRMPVGLEFTDIRRGSDLEFGQSIYEPFGINQLESLSCGTLCVISSVCGCLGFVGSLANSNIPDNIIVADYTRLDQAALSLEDILKIDQQCRDAVEHRVAAQVAQMILERLPQNGRQTETLIHAGYELAYKMSWDAVCKDYFLPALDRAYYKRRVRQIA